MLSCKSKHKLNTCSMHPLGSIKHKAMLQYNVVSAAAASLSSSPQRCLLTSLLGLKSSFTCGTPGQVLHNSSHLCCRSIPLSPNHSNHKLAPQINHNLVGLGSDIKCGTVWYTVVFPNADAVCAAAAPLSFPTMANHELEPHFNPTCEVGVNSSIKCRNVLCTAIPFNPDAACATAAFLSSPTTASTS